MCISTKSSLGGEVPKMGWRGRGWTSPWPGRGPYNNLPPWDRPGWLYGRGACWHLHGPYTPTAQLKPEDEAALLTEQKTVIEEQLKSMQEALKKIQERLEKLKK
jgi:hypothetical protein